MSLEHLRDISGILQICSHPIDHAYIEQWGENLNVLDIWKMILQRLQDSEREHSPLEE